MPLAHVAVPDLNNMVKFVLDGMNELVYQDDKQVAELVACKLFDSEDDCNGRTVVKVAKFTEEQVFELGQCHLGSRPLPFFATGMAAL